MATVSCDALYLGNSTTIRITGGNSRLVTVKYKLGSATGTIAENAKTSVITWSPDPGVLSTLYAQMPNATSMTGTITCEFWSSGIKVDTATCPLVVHTQKNLCSPTMNIVVEDTNAKTIAATGNKDHLVCYVSRPKVTANAVAQKSATIKAVQIQNPIGLIGTTSPFTFNTVYSEDFIVRATDSRGYSTEETYTVPKFIEYYPVHYISASISRPETTATKATANLTGYCFKGNFGAADNTLTLKYRYKTASGSYGSYATISNVTWNNGGTFEATVTINNLALDNVYYFEFVAEDKVASYVLDDVALDNSIGDIRFGKDYARFRNQVEVGSLHEDFYKPFRSMRKADTGFYTEMGASYIPDTGIKSLVLQLYEGLTRDSKKDKRLARYDIRNDGYMYNHDRSLGVAEMMSMAPAMTTSGYKGYLLLNAGSSTPVLIQWGRITKTPAGVDVVTSQSFNFLFPFNSVPAMLAVGVHNLTTNLEVFPATPTAEGATVYFKRGNTTNTGIYWIAIGDGTAAMPE